MGEQSAGERARSSQSANGGPSDPTGTSSRTSQSDDAGEGGPAGALGEPGQQLNLQQPSTPRPAATVILLRGGSQELEVLLVKRNEQARFMGGVWVFPGGAVDEGDGEQHRTAAVRELAEEASIQLDSQAELIEFSRWITPAQVAVRFDTLFYLAQLPSGQEPKVDGEECVALGWFTPAGALAAGGRQEIQLVFPTIKHLEQLSGFATVEELLAYARGREVLPIEPRVVLDDGVPRVLLPGEPDYE
jgi:8-oxo-dGTP pyrophosphatase MutT (NUDIX family)